MDAVRPWLYVGKYRETLNTNLLSARKIGAVLQLAEAVTYPDITSLYLPVEDGVPLPSHLLRQGVDFFICKAYHDMLNALRESKREAEGVLVRLRMFTVGLGQSWG